MNKIVNDKQCIIICHVGDLRMSGVDPDILSSVLYGIGTDYGNIAKMTITRGKIHKYPGMTIDYYPPGKVILYMVEYIGNMIYYTP